MDLIVNGVELTSLSLGAVKAQIKEATSIKNLEIWMSYNDGSSITALLNERRGWLLYSSLNPDKCLRTNNSSIASIEEDSYFLSNGQKDFYPNSYAYSREVIFDALSNFACSGQLDLSLNWVDGMA